MYTLRNVTAASPAQLSAAPCRDLAPDLGSDPGAARGGAGGLWQRHAVSLERYALWPGVYYID